MGSTKGDHGSWQIMKYLVPLPPESRPVCDGHALRIGLKLDGSGRISKSERSSVSYSIWSGARDPAGFVVGGMMR